MEEVSWKDILWLVAAMLTGGIVCIAIFLFIALLLEQVPWLFVFLVFLFFLSGD